MMKKSNLNIPGFFLMLLIMSTNALSQSSDKMWTLAQCIAYAKDHNLQLQQQMLTNQSNIAYLQQAKAARLPNMNATARSNYYWRGTNGQSINTQSADKYMSANLGATSSVILYNGNSINNSIQQSKLNVQAGLFDLQASQNNIDLSVTQAYLQILLANEQVGIAQHQIEGTQAQLDNAQSRYEKGLIAESSVLQVKAQLASEQASLTNAENQLRQTKITLMQLMELPVQDNFEITTLTPVDSSLIALPDKTSAQVYNNALQTRPEIKSAELQAQSAALGINIAQASKLPQLGLNANLTTSYSSALKQYDYTTHQVDEPIGYLAENPDQIVLGPVQQTTTTSTGYDWQKQLQDYLSPSVGLTLSVPIFNNKINDTKVQIAKINEQKALVAAQQTKNDLRKSIEQAYNDWLSATNEYKSALEQFTATQMTYQNAAYQFEQGIINATDLLIQKNNFTAARSSLVQAKYNVLFAQKILDFYEGKPITE